jgi:zinc transport system substrate-binding protein
VAVDISPVLSLVARVMQGLGVPDQIVRQGASPHGYALRPSEAGTLAGADAVFWIGPALAPWLEHSIDTLAPDAAVLRLPEVPGTTLLEFRQGAQFAAHADEDDHGDEELQDHDHGHEHDYGEDHGEDDDHDHAGDDPHAWLDPENGKVWLDAIADALGRLDPENAATYTANACDGKSEIDAANVEIEAVLAPAADL